MKLQEYIKKLQEINERYPDLEVIYATQEQGKHFSKVAYNPSICIHGESEFSYYRVFERDYDDFPLKFVPDAVCIN